MLVCAFANLAQAFPQLHCDESKLISRYLRQRRSQTDSKLRAPPTGIVAMDAIANMTLGYWSTYESSCARCFDQAATSTRLMETLAQLGITHRRTAYHHPEGNSYIERFHRSLKGEEVWTSEYRSLAEARESIARYLEEYNRDRPHRGVDNRTPHEAYLAFAVLTKNEALTV